MIERLKVAAQNTLLAAMPVVVLCLMIPLALYLPNQRDFDFSLNTIRPWLVLFVLWMIVAFVLALILPRLMSLVSGPLFYLGAFFGLSDILAPVQLGLLTGEEVKLEEPLVLTVIELLLAAGLLIAAFKVPRQITRAFGPIAVLVLIVSEIITFASGVAKETSFGNATAIDHPPPAKFAGGGNIYYIVMDGFSSHAFLDNLELFKAREALEGFVYLKNTRSNYFSTTMSFPSFMTSSYFGGGPLRPWLDSWKKKGIFAMAREAGYTITSYQTYKDFGPAYASKVGLFSDGPDGAPWDQNALNFAALWLVRVVPNFMQREVYFSVRRAFIQGVAAYPDFQTRRVVQSVGLMRRMIKEEKNLPARGQMVFGHILFPHGPYVMDSSCVYKHKAPIYKQSRCAFRLIVEFVNELKTLGRLKDATVIINADHGYWAYGPDKSQSIMDEQEAARMGIVPDTYAVEHGLSLDHRTRVLFLVKPPGVESAPFQVSEREVQLIDVAPTFAHMLNLEMPEAQGISALSAKFPKNRPLNLFMGFQRWIEGKLVRINTLPKSTIEHISYQPGQGWKMHEQITTTGE